MAPNKQKMLDAARDYVQKNNLPKAIREYQKLMELGMGDIRILLKIGELQAKLGQDAEAVKSFRGVAEEYAAEGFLDKAAAMYKRVLKIDPRLLDVHKQLAEVYHQLGLLSDAMAFYNSTAELLAEQGRASEQLDILRRMTMLDPENVGIHIKLAETLSRQGQVDEAVEVFQQAGAVLKAEGRLDDYVKVAERILFHRDDDAGLIKELVQLYLDRRETMAALGKLQIAYKRDPEDTECLGLLVQIFEQLGQAEKGLHVLREKARIHARRGEDVEAHAAWEGVLVKVPQDVEALKGLGRYQEPAPLLSADILRPLTEDNPSVLAQLQQPRGPLQQPPTQTAVPARQAPPPEDTPAEKLRRLLVETDVYIKYNLIEKALGHLETIFSMDPHHVEGYERLKAVRLQQGDYPAANEVLLYLARLVSPYDAGRGIGYLREAMEMMPFNGEASAVAAELGLTEADIFPEHARGGSANPFADLVDELSMDAIFSNVAPELGSVDGHTGAASLEHDVHMETGVHDVSELLGSGVGGAALAAVEDLEELDDDLLLMDDDDLAEAVSLDELDALEELDAGGLQPLPGFGGGSEAMEEGAATSMLSVDHMLGVAGYDAAGVAPPPPDDEELFLVDDDEEEVGGTGSPALMSMDAFGQSRPEAPGHASVSPSAALQTDLEEVDFYIAQGLRAEALQQVNELLQRWPGQPELLERKQLLLLGGRAAEPAPEPAPAPAPVAAPLAAAAGLPGLPARLIPDGVVHPCFDLGIALREMGLVQESMEELRASVEAGAEVFASLFIIGHDLLEQGYSSDAVAFFNEALRYSGDRADFAPHVHLHIGAAYQQAGDAATARQIFEQLRPYQASLPELGALLASV